MRRAFGVGLVLTVAGAGATVLGLAVLFGYAVSEVLANPELSIADGYWIGRLPWTAVGVDLVVVGATITVLFGTVSSWLAGGTPRRLVSLAPLAVVAAWWGFAAIESSFEGAPCVSCGQPSFDPFTVAYSVPVETIVLLVLPAAISLAIALSARRSKAMPIGAPPASPRDAAS